MSGTSLRLNMNVSLRHERLLSTKKYLSRMTYPVITQRLLTSVSRRRPSAMSMLVDGLKKISFGSMIAVYLEDVVA